MHQQKRRKEKSMTMTSFLYIVHKICSGISANVYEEKLNTVMMEAVKRNINSNRCIASDRLLPPSLHVTACNWWSPKHVWSLSSEESCAEKKVWQLREEAEYRESGGSHR